MKVDGGMGRNGVSSYAKTEENCRCERIGSIEKNRLEKVKLVKSGIDE